MLRLGRFLKKAPQKLFRLGRCEIRVNFTPTTCAGNKKGVLAYVQVRRLYSFFAACAPQRVAGLEIYYNMATLYVNANIVGTGVLDCPQR